MYDLWPFEKGLSLSVKCKKETDQPTKHRDYIKCLVPRKLKKRDGNKYKTESNDIIYPSPCAEESRRFVKATSVRR